MAISKLQPVVTSSGGVNTTYWTVTNQRKQYQSAVNLSAGIYQITTYPANNIAYVTFLDANNATLVSTNTVSGTVSVSIASTAKKIVYWTNGADNVLMGITQTGNSGTLTTISGGTLDTITSSGTYSQTGSLFVVCVGGGGGGAGGNGYAGAGGGGGGIFGGFVTTTSPTAVTIGAGGIGGNNDQATSGGNTSFGTYFTAGGGGKANYSSAGGGGYPMGGADGAQGYSSGHPAYEALNLYQSVVSGTTGGGGMESYGPAGSGIGTGGNTNSNATVGYGGGGGAGSYNAPKGYDGRQGVIYVLRNFSWI